MFLHSFYLWENRDLAQKKDAHLFLCSHLLGLKGMLVSMYLVQFTSGIQCRDKNERNVQNGEDCIA